MTTRLAALASKLKDMHLSGSAWSNMVVARAKSQMLGLGICSHCSSLRKKMYKTSFFLFYFAQTHLHRCWSRFPSSMAYRVQWRRYAQTAKLEPGKNKPLQFPLYISWMNWRIRKKCKISEMIESPPGPGRDSWIYPKTYRPLLTYCCFCSALIAVVGSWKKKHQHANLEFASAATVELNIALAVAATTYPYL